MAVSTFAEIGDLERILKNLTDETPKSPYENVELVRWKEGHEFTLRVKNAGETISYERSRSYQAEVKVADAAHLYTACASAPFLTIASGYGELSILRDKEKDVTIIQHMYEHGKLITIAKLGGTISHNLSPEHDVRKSVELGEELFEQEERRLWTERYGSAWGDNN